MPIFSFITRSSKLLPILDRIFALRLKFQNQNNLDSNTMYNRIILIGRLGKDAEPRGKENQVAALSIATTNYYKKKDGTAVEEVEWTNCIAFGKLAERVLNQAKKGDLVLCEGMKRTETYEKDGTTKTNVYVMLDIFRRLSWNTVTPAKESKPAETNQLELTK
jgi:single-strand DNA-binding protein